MTVADLQVAADGVLEFAGAAVSAAPQLFFGQRGEPALDQVEPGSARRREVQVEAWMTRQSVLDRRSLVGGVVIDDQMQLECGRHRLEKTRVIGDSCAAQVGRTVFQPSALDADGSRRPLRTY